MNSSAAEKHRSGEIYKVTIWGSIVSFLLIVIKFPAGIIGQSAALIADAAHSLSDFVTDIMILVFVKLSQKPRDTEHSYGHGKYETLATLIIGVVLLGVGVGIAWSGAAGVYSIMQGELVPRPSMIALYAALLTIVSKEILYHYTAIKGKKLNAPVLVANAWHHRSDGLSSIGTSIGIGGAIFLGDKWVVLDPLAATLVSVFIIVMAVKLIKSALDEFLERSLPEDTQNEIKEIVARFKDVHYLHNLCTRRVGSYYVIEFHVKMEGRRSLVEVHGIITEIEITLKEQYGSKTYVTIHPEPLATNPGEKA
jgi:cation diffusion facilitator family transporter